LGGEPQWTSGIGQAIDCQKIRIEARGGRPATVKPTHRRGEDAELLRIDRPR